MEAHKLENTEEYIPPYSMTVQEAAKHFGFAAQTLYDWVSQGRLHRGIHYLKVGRRTVIIREKFI